MVPVPEGGRPHLARSGLAVQAENEPPRRMNTYDQRFYGHIGPGSARSADIVLPLVAAVVPFESCVDIGCGTGEWLRGALAAGATRVLGIDGAYVDRSALRIDPNCFVAHQLETRLPPVGRFDLAMSMEVAEHLPEGRAASFVGDLCGLSDAVLFSGAAPGQGGTHHVNEQWPSYWVQLFADHGYMTFDIIRPWIWGDDRVAFWYRQNAFLAVKGDRHDLVARARDRQATAPARWDTPSLEMMRQQIRRAEMSPNTRQAATEFAKTAMRPARRRLALWQQQRRH